MTSRHCPQCDAAIPADAAEGLCRPCVLQAGMSEDLAPPTVRVRCPHCRHAIEVLGETELANVCCPRCDSRFDLVADETLGVTNDAPRRFGRFELLEVVGAGGFGSVWRCRDPELDRVVALKLPRKEQVGIEAEQFLREARAAAQLRHTGIVAVHEVGREDGRVYIVSDLIDGVDLAARLKHERPTPREAAELCARVAGALEHAHEAGVVHRDLKPSNILVDAEGEPHLTDFGLAKRDADEISITVTGKIIGTPAYMSPEQASGNAHGADRRTDIYSLGAVLFEMLTGEKPFRGDSQMLLYQVVHEDAPGPRRLNAAVPRDLEVICLKCLEKEPARRYGSAGELSDDLRRFLKGEPIRARRVSRVERTWRWARRNPVLSGLSAGLLIALVFGFAAVSWQWLRAEREIATNRRLLYASEMSSAFDALRSGRVDQLLELLERYRTGQDATDLRGWEWYHLYHEANRTRATRTIRAAFPSFCVTYSPDGQTLAIGRVASVALVDAASGVESTTLVSPSGGASVFRRVEFSPDGSLLAAAGLDGDLRLWDPGRRKEIRTFPGHEAPVSSLTFSADGSRLASGDWTGAVRVWDVGSGACQKVLRPSRGAIEAVVFSPDSHTLAAAGEEGSIALLDVTAEFRERTKLHHRAGVRALGFSPDGDVLASGGDDHAILLWSPSGGEPIGVLRAHTREIGDLAFTNDGATLASAGRDNTVRLWDVGARQLRRTLRGHSAGVNGVAFSHDGKTVASASSDGTVRLWAVDRSAPIDRVHGHQGMVWSVAFSPAGGLLASGSSDHIVRLFDPETGELIRSLDSHEGRVQSLCFSGDGNVLASGAFDGTVRLWDVRTGAEVRTISLENEQDDVFEVAISADGRLLATMSFYGLAQVWSTVSGRLVWTLGKRPQIPGGLAISPDGKVLAAGAGAAIELWRLSSGERLGTLAAERGHRGPVSTIAFSPDGRTIASGSRDALVVLWDVPTRSLRATCRGHAGHVWSVAFSPDGERVASSSMDKTVMLWDATSGTTRGTVAQGSWSVTSVAFSPDGKTLAAPEGVWHSDTVRLFRADARD